MNNNKGIVLDPNTKRFKREGVMVQENNNEPEELEGEELTLGRQVDALLEKGYSQKECRDQGYSPSLVRQRVRKRNKRLGVSAPESNKNGNGGNGKPQIALVKKEKEEVLPEYLAGQIEELYDGSPTERKAFLAGISVPLLGLRMFAEMVKPLGFLMQMWSAQQAEAAKAAQGGSEEVAQQTVVAAIPYFTDAMKDIARSSSPQPIQSMMARMLETTMTPMLQNMMGGMLKLPGQPQQAQSQSQGLPTGWVDNSQKEASK